MSDKILVTFLQSRLCGVTNADLRLSYRRCNRRELLSVSVRFRGWLNQQENYIFTDTGELALFDCTWFLQSEDSG